MALSRFTSLRGNRGCRASTSTGTTTDTNNNNPGWASANLPAQAHAYAYAHAHKRAHTQPQQRQRQQSNLQEPSARNIPSLCAEGAADDDALQLVAFRYEETVQAEPPVILLPVPPPRNPLRLSRPTTTNAALEAAPTNTTISASNAAPQALSLQTTKLLPPPTTAATTTITTTTRPSTVRTSTTLNTSKELPRIEIPPPVPPKDNPTAPARDSAYCSNPNYKSQRRSPQSQGSRDGSLRKHLHSPSSSSTSATSAGTDWNRDSALGCGTVSSASTTLIEGEAPPSRLNQDLSWLKLDLDDKDESPSSAYSTDYDGPSPLPVKPLALTRNRSHSYSHSLSNYGKQHDQHSPQAAPRFSCQSRWSFTESDVSDSESLKDRNSTRRIIKGLSVRLSPPMKRLKKQTAGDSASAAANAAVAVAAAVAMPPIDSPNQPDPQARLSHQSHQQRPTSTPPPQSSASLHSPAGSQDICHNVTQSPSSSNPRPLSEQESAEASSQPDAAPTISTSIPLGSLLDEDDLDSLNFSKRGSVYFGGRRAIGAPELVPGPSVTVPTEMYVDPRAAPSAPVATHGAASHSRSARADSRPGWRRHAKKSSLPDIRVMSEDTQRESQKVRSLYESGDLIHWQDGAPGLQAGELLEPPAEVPSEGDDNIAGGRPRENRNSVRAMYLSPTTPHSVTSLPSPRGSLHRNEFELAGGIEDWEDVHGEDVDRYGFISIGPRRPASGASAPVETRSLYSTHGKRNGRNVLTKRSRGPPLSQGLSRIPSRKISARSLNTQVSGISTQSRLSVRSSIRTAANMLPHNRDRRVIDAAGDMLSLPPGLADPEEEQKSMQAIKLAHDRESRRTEKWRGMAKMVTRGKDSHGEKFATEDLEKMIKKRAKKAATPEDKETFEIQGVEIEFDTKDPKLIERTWKGIPDRWRSAAWYSFLSTSARNAEYEVTADQLIARFHRLQEISSSDDLQIDLDVPRTINRHIMFRKRYRGGQRLLFRVLHALSLYFPDTGYVQGMAALAASLLCYYDEERCFVMLVWLWQFRGLARLYQHGFGGLMIALQDLEKHWLKGKNITEKLNELGIDPTAYGTRWYLTLFNLSIPFPAQLRVWDVFMLLGGRPSKRESDNGRAKQKAQADEADDELRFDGLDIIHATAAALIDMHKDVILDGDFENVMKGLTSFQEVKDEDKFIALVRAEWNMHRGKRKG